MAFTQVGNSGLALFGEQAISHRARPVAGDLGCACQEAIRNDFDGLRAKEERLSRGGFIVGGILLLLTALLLPPGWYDALPRRGDLPVPEFRGDTILKVCLVLQAGLFFVLAVLAPSLAAPAAGELAKLPPRVEDPRDLGAGQSALLLAALALVGLVLRLYNTGSDLWLDEINPVVTFRDLPYHQVFTTYLLSGNHQFHTFLVKLLVSLLGEKEWVIRLPAVTFGTACIPAAYWLARFALTRWQALSVALLVAVSYHLVFFSQNARGYTAHIFFSLVTSGLVLVASTRREGTPWLLFAVLSYLSFLTQMIGAFVTAGHLIIFLLFAWQIRARGASPFPLLKRVAATYAVLGACAVTTYSVVLPDFLSYQKYFYQKDETSGFRPFSLEFLQEMIRGIGQGFGPGFLLGAVPFLLIAAFGFQRFWRRSWPVALSLTFPCLLLAGYLVGRSIPVSPRFFLIAIPVAFMAAVVATWESTDWLAGRRMIPAGRSNVFSLAIVGLVALASLVSLAGLYAHPKQDYSGAIRYIQARRRADQPIIVVHFAERGMKYYGARAGWHEGADMRFVRSLDAFRKECEGRDKTGVFAVTTLWRNLKIEAPGIARTLGQDWKKLKEFPGTIGDGTVTVWGLGIEEELH